MKKSGSDDYNEGEKQAAFFAQVSGRVQGVGYRYFAMREAERLNINGWVRNSYNGEVEIWAEGAERKLEIFLARLREGPHYSHVVSVVLSAKVPEGYGGFDVKY